MTLMWPGLHPIPRVNPLEPIFGFTFQQPYATCVIDGDKRDENRSKPPPARFFGRAFWIAVHAGATFYPDVDRADFTSTSLLRTDAQGNRLPPLWPECPDFGTMPTRVVLGAARVVGWTDNVSSIPGRPWAFGPCVWHLDPTVVRLPRPLPLRLGALGLWNLVPTMDDKPERVSEQDWRQRIDEGAAVLAGLRACLTDRTAWRTVHV